MIATIVCPSCGETDRLSGRREERGVVVTCDACGHEWLRDPDVCPSCARRTVADKREPLMQKARGTQQSIIGFRIVKECWSCGWRGT